MAAPATPGEKKKSFSYPSKTKANLNKPKFRKKESSIDDQTAIPIIDFLGSSQEIEIQVLGFYSQSPCMMPQPLEFSHLDQIHGTAKKHSKSITDNKEFRLSQTRPHFKVISK